MGAIWTEEQVALAVDSPQQVRELRKLATWTGRYAIQILSVNGEIEALSYLEVGLHCHRLPTDP